MYFNNTKKISINHKQNNFPKLKNKIKYQSKNITITLKKQYIIKCHSKITGDGNVNKSTKNNTLSELLSWSKANGIRGIGEEQSKIGIYEDTKKERGIISIYPIKENEIIMEIPLKIAITDFKEDYESNSLLYKEAPWSVRLACKLLRLKSEGYKSAWYPYIKALPEEVKCVSQTYKQDEINKIKYQELINKLNYMQWIKNEAWQQMTPKAHNNSTKEEFDWAMSIVHSRVFGTAGKQGGVGVRMLLPFADMINHGGDKYDKLIMNKCSALDNVRWELKNPNDSKSGEWEMIFYAIRDIKENQEILMSYGERNNDDFFLYYGFIPECNPSDDIVIFESITEAIHWFISNYKLKENLTEDEIEQIKLKVIENEEDVILKQFDVKNNESLRKEVDKLRVMSGSFIDGRLISILKILCLKLDDKNKTVEDIIKDRCIQILSDMTPLIKDFEFLIENDEINLIHGFEEMMTFYKNKLEKIQIEYKSNLNNNNRDILKFSDSLTTTYMCYKKIILWNILLGYFRN